MDESLLKMVAQAEQRWSDGQDGQAEQICRDVLLRSAHCAPALHLLGMICNQSGRVEEALNYLARAVACSPNDIRYQSNFAAALGNVGKVNQAAQVLRDLIKNNPHLPMPHNNLGAVLERMGRHAEAINSYKRACELKSNDPMLHCNLGGALRLAHRFEEAEAAYRRAVAIRDDYAPAWSGLALALQQLGRLEESIRCLREALRTAPDLQIHSTLVFSLHYLPQATDDMLLNEARNWAAAYGRSSGEDDSVFCNPRTANRPLRIGYLSPDLRNHVIGRLMEPVLGAHDRSVVEIFAFSDASRPDVATARMRQLVDHWHDVWSLSDRALKDLILKFQIDILVETAGHFGGNRLRLMAMRAAPIQISAFGYCGTTGIPAIDYRITDPHSDPPGITDGFHTEKLLRLPHCANCYQPTEASPALVSPPSRDSGIVTFCCLNNPVKITDPAIETWSRILKRLPTSRLRLLMAGGENAMKRRFAAHGVLSHQVEVSKPQERLAYLQLHNQCDICLDCFPFHGDNTSFDALWMGLPVITLAGARFSSRRGVSHMINLGHPEWIASNLDEYVERAVDWASDTQRLARIRAVLRREFQQSPLGDLRGWTRDLENAYHAVWQRWLLSAGKSSKNASA